MLRRDERVRASNTKPIVRRVGRLFNQVFGVVLRRRQGEEGDRPGREKEVVKESAEEKI